MAKTLLLPCAFTAFVAKTLRLACVYTAFVSNTLALPCATETRPTQGTTASHTHGPCVHTDHMQTMLSINGGGLQMFEKWFRTRLGIDAPDIPVLPELMVQKVYEQSYIHLKRKAKEQGKDFNPERKRTVPNQRPPHTLTPALLCLPLHFLLLLLLAC